MSSTPSLDDVMSQSSQHMYGGGSNSESIQKRNTFKVRFGMFSFRMVFSFRIVFSFQMVFSFRMIRTNWRPFCSDFEWFWTKWRPFCSTFEIHSIRNLNAFGIQAPTVLYFKGKWSYRSIHLFSTKDSDCCVVIAHPEQELTFAVDLKLRRLGVKISAEIVTQNSFCIMRRKNISKYCQLCKNIILFWQNAATTLGFETLKNI